MTKNPPAPLWSRTLYGLRNRLAARALRSADAYVMGSRAIRDDYLEHGLLRPADQVYVLPYGVDTPASVLERAQTTLPVRFACVGAVLPHKGLHVAAEALAGIEGATLDVWGNDEANPDYARQLRHTAPDRVRLRGRFTDEDKPQVFASMDVLLMPSLGKESFGLVAREALAHGVPVVASRHGALAELFDDHEHPAGALLPPGDVGVWRGLLVRLVADPSRIDRWPAAIRPVVALAEHAEAVEQVYEDVLARFRRRDR